MRADLLALTADDLAALTNRGTVKRAAARARGTVAVREEAGRDGRGASADDADGRAARRACRSRTRAARARPSALCRHIVRAVLAYAAAGCRASRRRRVLGPGRRDRRGAGGCAAPGGAAARPALVARGVTATLVRSAKPMALLHDVEATVRFLVPHDLAYARCDCADQPPCEHVVPPSTPSAPWTPRWSPAWSSSPPAAAARRRECSPPVALAARGRGRALRSSPRRGLAGGGAAVAARCAAPSGAAREDGLPWPADVCAELADLVERHARARRRVRPAAGRAARRRGRAARRRAPRRQRARAVRRRSAPHGRDRGRRRAARRARHARPAGRARSSTSTRSSTTPTAHRVLALGRTFGDPDDAPPRAFADLAADDAPAVDLDRERRRRAADRHRRRAAAPGGRLQLGRRPAALSAQRFEWDKLLQRADARRGRRRGPQRALGRRAAAARPAHRRREPGRHPARHARRRRVPRRDPVRRRRRRRTRSARRAHDRSPVPPPRRGRRRAAAAPRSTAG